MYFVTSGLRLVCSNEPTASEKEKLELKIEELREVQSTMRQLASDMDSQALGIAKEALRHKEQLPKIEQASLAYIDAQIKLAEAESDVAALKTKNQQVHDLLEEGKRVIARLGQEAETLKERGLALGAEVRESMQDTTEEDLARINEMLGEKPSEEVRNELQAQKSRLEYVHAADPGVIRQFEMRAKEIEKLQQTMARRQGQADELAEEIAQIRAEWEPQVDELVGRINDAFSYNFEQISCAGEISIHKDEDFSQWAINIKVKFRYVICLSVSYGLSLANPLFIPQRTRGTAATGPTSPVRWRAVCQHHILPHVASVNGPGALPRCRRDKPRYGPTQRAHGP